MKEKTRKLFIKVMAIVIVASMLASTAYYLIVTLAL